ncbi:MAG TPA: hypothetical protein PLV45_14450, partial [bacterium]|nr:hypothetical protein [bacterium]
MTYVKNRSGSFCAGGVGVYLGYILSLAVLAGVWGCSGSGNGSGRNAESLLRPPSPAPANIVLISLDTLRADHLGGWGYP